MTNKSILTKFIIFVFLVITISPVSMVAYSYWNDLTENKSNEIIIGEWWGIPISTAQEFYNLATGGTTTSDDVYYLTNDIDFSGFSWTLDSYNGSATFRGTLDGNGMTISNLTITTTSYNNDYLGIFPRMEGGSVYNLTLSNIDLVIGYSYTSVASGLITGNIYGLSNTIEDITIINAGVRGNSTDGTGGLVGNIENSSTIVDITNIKASGLKVFSTNSYVGGLVGSLRSGGVDLNVSDVDIEGEVSSMTTSSYTGGVLGYITNGAYFQLTRAIVEMTSQNTLETGSYYLRYSNRYLGGFIGYNQSTYDKVIIEDSFFTGSLISSDSRRAYYIGTAIGRSSGSQTITNSFYSMVLFRNTDGSITYYPSYSPRGVMTTRVNASSMPSSYWWDSFAVSFITSDNIWSQEVSSGQLYIDR